MKLLDKHELLEINGGTTISGTLINALVKGITTVLDLGRSLGTAIRMISNNTVCKI